MVTKFLKKKIAIALVAAMAIGGVTPTKLVPSFKMENVKAAASAVMSADFDYGEKLLKNVKRVGDSTISFGLGSVFYYQSVLYTVDKNGTEVLGTINPNKWTAVEVGTDNGVDFSWLSFAKKQMLYVASDPVAVKEGTEEPAEILINAQNTTLKIKFYGTLPAGTADDYCIGNSITGYLVSEPTMKKTEVLYPAIPFSSTQYKTENGEWTNVTDDLTEQLLKYINKGVKLQFRVASVNKQKNVAGKTVSVAYPAKANGPKVTVDFNKQQITFPKGTEYILANRYLNDTATWVTPKNSANETTDTKPVTLYFDQLDSNVDYDIGDDKKILYVRTKAVAGKGCSKITTVTLGKATETASSVINVANGNDLLASSYTEATDGKVLIQYATPYIATTTAKGKTTSTIAITNNSTEAYQVAVVLKDDLKDNIGDFYSGTNFTAAASRIKIGDSTSKIKFTDVKGYTVNKKGEKVAGTAKIATTLASEKSVSDYVILYRQFNKSSKTNTAPGKIYMANMPVALTQTLTANQGNTSLSAYTAGATPTITVNGNSEFTLSLANIVNTKSSPTVTVWKEAECKNVNKDITVKVTKDGNNAKLTWTVNKEDNKETGAYVKVVWESVTQYYYISYSKTSE